MCRGLRTVGGMSRLGARRKPEAKSYGLDPISPLNGSGGGSSSGESSGVNAETT